MNLHVVRCGNVDAVNWIGQGLCDDDHENVVGTMRVVSPII